MGLIAISKNYSYRGISFRVIGKRIVAELAPLAFLDFSEEIGNGEVSDIITRLYERVAPLLLCRHCWVAHNERAIEGQELIIVPSLSARYRLLTCLSCTAFVLATLDNAAPRVGRGDL